MKSLLVVSGSPEVYAVVRSCFSEGYRVDQAADEATALRLLRDVSYGVVMLDLDRLNLAAPGGNLEAAFQPYWTVRPAVVIVLAVEQAQAALGETALRAGASHCLVRPLDPREVRRVVEGGFRSLLLPSEDEDPLDRFWRSDSLEVVRSRSPGMQEVLERLRSVAPTRSTVLLTGETGTGKGVLARLIHRHSNRWRERFTSVHCGAIPDTLLESELFGHEKGAFTGAVRRKPGKFETARGGTIFLDEVGTITASAQIKLLQVLHEGTFHRVGGDEPIQADVRVIAATNEDLEVMCASGRFRKDLYYRLNVFPVHVPPLRERVEDIPTFIEIFLRKLNRLNTKEIYGVEPTVRQAFSAYGWPGNIRELENLLERAYILETSPVLTAGSFPAELMEVGGDPARPAGRVRTTLAEARRLAVDEAERRYLRNLLRQHRGVIRDSAASAGISTRQLHKLMKKHGLRKEIFRGPTTRPPG